MNKRPQAKYCGLSCKRKANRNLSSLEQKATSLYGRAQALWHNSRKRDHTNHSISLEWIQHKLEIGVCERTDIPFEFVYKQGRTAYAPSLDKIDPSKGYTEDNTQVVIWMYNAAKNIFTDADVLYMAKCLVNKES